MKPFQSAGAVSNGYFWVSCRAQPTGGRARYTRLRLAVEMMVDSSHYESISMSVVNSIQFDEGSLMLFAYFGPETMMPVASVIAAAAGVVMMFGRSILQFGRGVVRRVWPGPRAK
jgi:hypothetical protein